ncbi:MAG: MBL fold metallo-hydrolase [Oscillospiraceae bacterium]|nr:MBL fold metallo-hydrolase [Oscillospiraceae bacterium]
MLAKILIDNAARDGLCAEWGLSIWLEYREHCFLLDAGATEKFAENATAMGLHLADASFGVLSHAHYDHADGLDAFFAQNRHAPVYLRRGAAENCYRREGLHLHYIGIRRGYLEQYQARFRYVDGVFSPEPGVTLLPHSTPGLSAAGRRAGMYIRNRGTLLPRPDSFAHEQTLVLEAADGLVVFNSCSHGGADCILQEVAAAFPGRRICAFVGGLHLFRSTEQEVRALARRLRDMGITALYTGHCTGERAIALLREELGDGVHQFYSGMEIQVD